MEAFFGHLGNPWLPFGPQKWSGWLQIGRAIHVVRYSGQTVDSRPILGKNMFFGRTGTLVMIWAWPGLT